jgi:hypothetical protein
LGRLWSAFGSLRDATTSPSRGRSKTQMVTLQHDLV